MHRIFILGLSFIGGYMDTATFISSPGLFCNHVTGNIILFVSDFVYDYKTQHLIKLLTIPVMIIGLIFSAYLYSLIQIKFKHKCPIKNLILIQASLMIIVGCLSFVFVSEYQKLFLSLILVMSMAIQNTVHSFVPAPMTTVMTGNVSKMSMGIAKFLHLKLGHDIEQIDTKELEKYILIIASFIFGAICAALLAPSIGLKCTLFSGLFLIILSNIKSH